MRTYLREAQITYRRTGRLPEVARGAVARSGDIAPLAQELIGARITESFLVLALQAKNHIMGFHEVARGGTTSCPVAAADAFRYPVATGAVSIIVAHNHPSGDPMPSLEDIELTCRLRKAGELLGIQLLDHLVVTQESYISLLDSGLLK